MNKEELIKLIESLKMEDIVIVEITYYDEKSYGTYQNRKKKTITFTGGKNE